MHNLHRKLVAVATALVFPYAAALAVTAAPSPALKAMDLGSFTAKAPGQQLTVTVALQLQNRAAAEALLKQMYTAGSATYMKFLSADEFRAQFAPSAASIAKVTANLEKFGLQVSQASSTTLKVTGPASAFESAFQVSLHEYALPAHDNLPASTYHAPVTPVTVSSEIAPLVTGVYGLSTRPAFKPHLHHSVNPANGLASTTPKTSASNSGDPPGLWTVTDFAAHYDVTPLYNEGLSGKGRTIGIVTLASFTPSDAFTYWSTLGLKVDPKRLTIVNVDGGAGAPSDVAGSGETSLDVEQSGGVAPGAKIIVYIAPNTSQAFVDAFAEAIDANKADSISTSWGSWEWFDNLENSPVDDPYSGKTVSSLKAMDQLFLQAALQGESLFASAGDAGAYDANDGLLPPQFSLALSVDSPASDPYITAAGGTTLAGEQIYVLSDGSEVTVNIPHERIWSWDYLVPLCADLGYTPLSCGIFPVGGGGGVSIEFPTPFYQLGVQGVQRSQPGQSFIQELPAPPVDYFDLPAHYAGRNLPDVSFNADPDTGYVIFYTANGDGGGPVGFEVLTFYGGTSFVAPQLNGVTALLSQSVGRRIGLLNVPLYFLAQTGGYAGSKAPLKAIQYGNNDFYTGTNGYNPGAGVGILDVANLNAAFKKLYGF